MAQQITPEVINCSGQNFSNSSARLVYSVGEVAITSIGNSTNSITQGFLQPQSTLSSVNDNQTQNTYTTFPNPATDQIIIASSNNTSMLILKVIDCFGRVVMISATQNNSISISALPVGLYQLLIMDQDPKRVTRKTFTKI